jgi:hypothetical protein
MERIKRICALCKYYDAGILGGRCSKLNVGLTGLDQMVRAKKCKYYEYKYA